MSRNQQNYGKNQAVWEQYGPELLCFEDRGNRHFVLGPTHEEDYDLVRRGVIYRQLPPIYTKFKPNSVMKCALVLVSCSREFIMKDAYSFHADRASLQQTYDVMYQTYSNIFNRLGLDRAVRDTGSIGGSASHEFRVSKQW